MLTLVIYATHSEGYYDILVQRAQSLNYSIKILGWGKKWLGFYKRTLDLYNYFLSCPDDEIILSIDGYDSFVLEDAHILLNKYYSFNSSIVWGIDAPDFLKTYIFYSKYNYVLNGGCFIGSCYELKLVFKEIIKHFGTKNFTQDDQKIVNYMNNYNELFQSLVVPDIQSSIFANVMYDSFIKRVYNYFDIPVNCDTLSHIYTGERIIDKHTGITPSIISGPANINIAHLIQPYCPEAKHSRKMYKFFLLYNFRYELLFCVVLLIGIIFFIILIYRKINVKNTTK